MSKRPIINGIEIAGFLPQFIRELRDAIRRGDKIQTRRVIKPQPLEVIHGIPIADSLGRHPIKCPYGKPGEIRALREPIINVGGYACWDDDEIPTTVRTVKMHHLIPWRWKVNKLSQQYMPYEAARTFAEVKEIRVEKLQNITVQDVILEGVLCECKNHMCRRHIELFVELWDSINSKRGYPFCSNPWVWVETFKLFSFDNNKIF